MAAACPTHAEDLHPPDDAFVTFFHCFTKFPLPPPLLLCRQTCQGAGSLNLNYRSENTPVSLMGLAAMYFLILRVLLLLLFQACLQSIRVGSMALNTANIIP